MSTETTPQTTFFEAIAEAFRRYSDFNGTSSRSRFWWFFLFFAQLLFIASLFTFVQLAPGVTVGSILASIVTIALIVPLLAVGVRRLRDSGDGWKNIFWLLIPIAGLIVLAYYWAHPTKATSDVERTP